MQSALMQRQAQLAAGSRPQPASAASLPRPALHAVPVVGTSLPSTSSAGPSSRVQAQAKRKGGGGGTMMGGRGMQMAPPSTPEVDPENVEFVIFVRGRNFMEGRIMVQEGKWAPLSVVKGGAAANYLAKAMESPWGRMLYSRTLLRNIGMAIYRDKDAIEEKLKASYPPFANLKSKNFRYGFKIRDQSDPKAWSKSEGVTEFPLESDIAGTAADDLKKLFSAEQFAGLFAKA